MYRFFLYVILVITYLGLSKALSPSEVGIYYLQNEKGFSKVIAGNNITAILIDRHTTGFLFRTYYQKYRIVHGLNSVEEIIVRTSKDFFKKNKDNIGMSIYRRVDKQEEYLPLPPGSMYVGNTEFGYWKTTKDGEKKWQFYHLFRHLPKYLGWGNFRPDEEFYQKMKTHQVSGKSFYGLHREFGTEGSVTKKNFPQHFAPDRNKKAYLKDLLIEYIKNNF